ncbi:MAG: hypothetical protein H6719_13575 [Sandaracinaceae bacterium]|nr:hypothetical protein [Sandaracinaceae bacterium]
MTDAPKLKLSKKEESRAWDHYSGNCFTCERCALFEAINAGKPGAVEKYVRYMREVRGEDVETEPA